MFCVRNNFEALEDHLNLCVIIQSMLIPDRSKLTFLQQICVVAVKESYDPKMTSS